MSLIQAKQSFLDPEKPLLGKVDKFASSVLTAIDKALPSLEKEIAWKELLAKLTKVIVDLIKGNFDLARNRLQFFTTKTEFTQTVIDLKETILNTHFSL